MESTSTGIRLVQDLLERLNAHDVDHAALLYASDYRGLDVSRGLLCDGQEDVRREYTRWLTAFPDLHVTSHDILVAAHQLTVYWTLEGTHQGTFMRIPKTGRPLTFSGFSVMTVREALFVRGLHLWDMAGMLRAMKLLPDLPYTQAGVFLSSAPGLDSRS